ncbi:MAG TPA: hypothetical protein VKR57_08155 [Terriglobales bacterium]|jgi:probable HAF family extracellular repeat protein|nr:hypothetical protein [Terriglobales bacterium]
MTRATATTTCALVLVFLVPFAIAQQYTIADLGALSGDTYSAGLGINFFGHVAGCSGVANYQCANYNIGPYGHAFLVEHTGMVQLPAPGSDTSLGLAINDRDEVVGEANLSTLGFHAVLWTEKDGIKDLGTLPGGAVSGALGINDSGSIAGFSAYEPQSAQNFHAVLWSSEGMKDLGTLPGGNYSQATALNLFGKVVGNSDNAALNDHAFLWTEPDGMQDLGVLPGGTSSYATGINNLDEIVGYSNYSDNYNSYHAVIWTQKEGIKELAPPGDCYALAINDLGTIVGSCGGAVLWNRKGEMKNLNLLIPPNSGWDLIRASAINIRGQITGAGTINGETHAFLLTPSIPHPQQ